jgi:phage tail sheath gpL-like
MAIPIAVSPSVLTPGLYLTVDLLAGTSSPGAGTLRTALIATRSSSGDLTDDTEVRAGSGAASASTAFGAGTVGHLAAKALYNKYPNAVVDFISPAAGAGTATLDLTLTGTTSSNNVIDLDIMGVEFEVAWLAAETADEVRTKIINAIVQRTNVLACTAVSGGSGVVTINSKVLGNVGNDILVKAALRNAQTSTETIAGAATHTALSGGTTDPDLTTALSLLQGKEYHYIVACLSNADVANISTANNLSKIATHIENLDSGLNAKLQQFIVGYTGSLANAIASAPHANSAGNNEWGEILLCINGRSLPGVFGAREAGGRLAAVSVDPAANRIGELLDGAVGSYDIIADRPTAAESESALGAGVSIVSYTAQDAAYLVRAVTTHSQDSAGGDDTRLLDTQNVDAAYIVARDIRDNMPLEFPQAKIATDRTAGDEPLPAGVIEERDIKAWIISRLQFWKRQGVVDAAGLAETLANDELIVQVNATDPTQVDCVVPFKVVQPLAKFGVTAQRQPS